VRTPIGNFGGALAAGAAHRAVAAAAAIERSRQPRGAWTKWCSATRARPATGRTRASGGAVRGSRRRGACLHHQQGVRERAAGRGERRVQVVRLGDAEAVQDGGTDT
jgi:hypothetical protein